MPRNGSGTFTLAEPAFVPGTTIAAAPMNSDLTDIATALTGSLARNGEGGMSAVLPLDASGLTFVGDTNTGLSRTAADTMVLTCGGTSVMTLTPATVTIHVAVTLSGLVVTTSMIQNSAVTYAKIQNVAANSLLGSIAGGVVAEISCTAAGRSMIGAANAAAQSALLGLGTAATQNTGTSGANVPLLNGNNTYSGTATFSGAFSVTHAAGVAAKNTAKAFGRVASGVLQAGSFNVASVTDGGTFHTIAFTTAMPNDEYVVITSPSAAAIANLTSLGYGDVTTADFRINGYQADKTPVDPESYSFIVLTAS